MPFRNYIFWDPDPIAIGPLFGNFSIAWYGILFAFAFLFGYIIITRLFKMEKVPELVRDKMLLYVVIGTVVGARLGHCFFYDPAFYLSHPLEILNLRGGGLASHGAAIGLILAMYIFAKRISKRHILWGLDRLVIVVALSGLFIRSGNLVNQEINGKTTNSAFGFVFPTIDQLKPYLSLKDSDEGMKIHMQLPAGRDSLAGRFYVQQSADEEQWETVREVVILSSRDNPFSPKNLAPDSRRVRDSYFYTFDEANQRLVFPQYELQQSLKGWSRNFTGYDTLPYAQRNTTPILSAEEPVLIVDQSREPGPIHYRIADSQGISYATSHYVGRHPAQLYEAFSYLLIFFLLLFLYVKRRGKVPEGELFGLFLVLTFSARFVIEFFKEVQEPWEQALPIDMGQILSIPFVLLGAAVLIWVFRRKEKLLNAGHEWPKEYFEKSEKKEKGGKGLRENAQSGKTGNKSARKKK